MNNLPPPQQVAFLLDFDGTLVDIAPTPELVVVPTGLAQTLVTLRDRCGGALGVVSGRPIAQIDHFLAGIPHAVAGEHGIAVRHAPDQPVQRAELPELPPEWLDEAERIVARHPGARVEHKHTGLVLHFRAVPEAGPALREAAEELLARDPMRRFHLQAAKMAWELKPGGIDKGTAVRQLMQQPPFAGRVPVFVGDDVTDEDGIRAAEAMGGIGLRIPEDFATPALFRAWLAELARSDAEAGSWGG